MFLSRQVIATVLIFLLFAIATSDTDYTVRVIYFQPTDAPTAAPVTKIRNAMEYAQKFYADEMQKHGFGRKTFTLERDNAGEIVIHNIKGRHAAQHYFNDTKGTLDAELPANMKNQNDILLSFIGGLNGVAGGWNGQGQAWFGHDCGACKGWTAVGNKNADFALSTVAHELGHGFGLYHNLTGKHGANFLMWFDGVLDTYEARGLDKSRYFNTGNHIVRPPPRITNPKRPEAIQRDNRDYVRFSADINAGQGLYHAQLFRDTDHCVLDWTRLSGQSDTATFDMPRAELIGESRVWIHAQANDGNQSLIPVDFTLPAKSGTVITETIETDRTETYLTLSYDSPDALTPTNPQNEWGWDWGGWQQTWEKTPDGNLPPKPYQGFAAANTIPYTKEWDYFFYAHYPSQIVYDLSGGNYTQFDAYFDMPNPCVHIATPASMEVTFLADSTEIYNTGVFRGDAARNTHITFDIPENTQTLTIKITDAGDGGTCDHFIFANARLLHSETTPIEFDDSYDNNNTDENSYTDVNTDGLVNIVDLVLVAARYGEKITGNPNPNPDVNRNGMVDIEDLIQVATAIDSANSAYSAPASQPLAPKETALLPNYPNPFNPETWIPYQLAKDNDVTITIYNTQGVFLRRLPISYQSAGYYIRRNRAAYWDGHNNVGERVARSIYFYQLQADNVYLLRKMLILK